MHHSKGHLGKKKSDLSQSVADVDDVTLLRLAPHDTTPRMCPNRRVHIVICFLNHLLLTTRASPAVPWCKGFFSLKGYGLVASTRWRPHLTPFGCPSWLGQIKKNRWNSRIYPNRVRRGPYFWLHSRHLPTRIDSSFPNWGRHWPSDSLKTGKNWNFIKKTPA